jgi:cytosine/adenosine deaminase-related metal-dependent hydrolase
MIIRARSVVTMDGARIANGAVAVAGTRIADVGTWSEVRSRNTGEVVDLGEVSLLPGLINAHCHLDYTDMRGAIPPPNSFASWIRAINAHKATWSEADYLRSISNGIAEAARFGTTTIANLEAIPSLIADVPTAQMRVYWFPELIDVREPVSARKAFDTAAGGLAPHAPYTASRRLYEAVADVVRGQNAIATTHLAESREEMEMFRHARGPLFDLLSEIGRPMDDCGAMSPLELLLDRHVLDERWLIAHFNELTPHDFVRLERAPRFHIVHCPRSHAYFGHSPFALRKLRELGFNICVGTDSLASNGDLSLLAELRQLRRNEPSLSARELLAMVTTRAAAALRQEHAIGRIAPRYLADLIAIPFAGKADDAFENAVECTAKTEWRMVNGEVGFPR